MAVVNRYFDQNDYQKPIKSYIQSYFWNVVPSLKKKSDIYVSQYEALLQDDLF